MTESWVLLATAAAIAFTHTLLGPDHYVPFIAMAKARSWNGKKTARIALYCGLGHVLGSVLLGFVGIAAGWSLDHLVQFESSRGSLAAWLLIAFGLVYLAVGLRRLLRVRARAASGADGTEAGPEMKTPFFLFLIFLFGPCEPLIPLLLYPAAAMNSILVLEVALLFGCVTLGTMLGCVLVGLKGLSFFPALRVRPYAHVVAGFTICASGLAIRYLGL